MLRVVSASAVLFMATPVAARAGNLAFQVMVDGEWNAVCCNQKGQPPQVSKDASCFSHKWVESGRVLTDLKTSLRYDCPESSGPLTCYCKDDGERMHGAPGGHVQTSIDLLPGGAPIFPDIGRATCSYVSNGIVKTRVSSVKGNKWSSNSGWPDKDCPHWRLAPGSGSTSSNTPAPAPAPAPGPAPATGGARVPVPRSGACDWGLNSVEGFNPKCAECAKYIDGRPGKSGVDWECVYATAEDQCFPRGHARGQGMTVQDDCAAPATGNDDSGPSSNCLGDLTKEAEKYLTCNSYCSSLGKQCRGAWEDSDNTCTGVKGTETCSTDIHNKYGGTSDMICKCAGAGEMIQLENVECVDNAEYLDMEGFNCSTWSGANCSAWPNYNENQLHDLQSNCAQACGLCSQSTTVPAVVSPTCSTTDWPDANPTQCGHCKALISNFATTYKGKCSDYCKAAGMACLRGWEDGGFDEATKMCTYGMEIGCDRISRFENDDAICECGDADTRNFEKTEDDMSAGPASPSAAVGLAASLLISLYVCL